LTATFWFAISLLIAVQQCPALMNDTLLLFHVICDDNVKWKIAVEKTPDPVSLSPMSASRAMGTSETIAGLEHVINTLKANLLGST
jgi:hypothetical protein